jgi:hypothetical protein
MRPTDNNCIASHPNNVITAAQARTLRCGRAGCSDVVIYNVGTDWRTDGCPVSDHSVVCKGVLYGLANAPRRSDAHSAQYALRPLAPASWGVHGGNRRKVIAGHSKQRKKEHQRKKELDDDEYTEDVKPTSVKCRGCQRTLKLDKRSRYYPGLWLKHRGKCPRILKIEVS